MEADYLGDRLKNQRFGYSLPSRSGMIEIPYMLGNVFWQKLAVTSGIDRLQWQSSKTSQGNISDGHHMERNILVYSTEFPDKPFEFELTTSGHTKKRKKTVTAMFKETPEGPRVRGLADSEIHCWRVSSLACR